MDDIDKTPEVKKISGKCKDDYRKFSIYSGWIDEFGQDIHMYMNSNKTNGHTSTNIEHIKLAHKLMGDFIDKYDKAANQIEKDRVVIDNCIDCKSHSVINDPDPDDWFCDDDVAVVCTLTQNNDVTPDSKYQSDMCAFKSVTRSCRPFKIRKESDVPPWCPKGYYKYIKKNKKGDSNGDSTSGLD